MDKYYDEIYTIKDGKFELVASGEYGAPNNAKLEYDKNGEPIYVYFWNGTKVADRDAYLAAMNEVYPEATAHNPLMEADYSSELHRYTDNEICNYEEILERLK